MLLEIENAHAGYGLKPVLREVSVRVHAGEIVAIIGPNGAGKSTLLKSIFGLLPSVSGSLLLGGHDLLSLRPWEIGQCGVGYCPQGSRVFRRMTVRENLVVGGYGLPKDELRSQIEQCLCVFPFLSQCLHRKARQLSGGEQQMLSLARSLLGKPKLLMLDEPSLGLSPSAVEQLYEKIAHVNSASGVAFLIVEHRVQQVLAVSSRVYALKSGQVTHVGLASELAHDRERLRSIFL